MNMMNRRLLQNGDLGAQYVPVSSPVLSNQINRAKLINQEKLQAFSV